MYSEGVARAAANRKARHIRAGGCARHMEGSGEGYFLLFMFLMAFVLQIVGQTYGEHAVLLTIVVIGAIILSILWFA